MIQYHGIQNLAFLKYIDKRELLIWLGQACDCSANYLQYNDKCHETFGDILSNPNAVPMEMIIFNVGRTWSSVNYGTKTVNSCNVSSINLTRTAWGCPIFQTWLKSSMIAEWVEGFVNQASWKMIQLCSTECQWSVPAADGGGFCNDGPTLLKILFELMDPSTEIVQRNIARPSKMLACRSMTPWIKLSTLIKRLCSTTRLVIHCVFTFLTFSFPPRMMSSCSGYVRSNRMWILDLGSTRILWLGNWFWWQGNKSTICPNRHLGQGGSLQCTICCNGDLNPAISGRPSCTCHFWWK